MREYARVCPKFWTGRTGRWLRTQDPLIKVAAMYLMTCPYSEMTGLYYLPVDIMAHDIGCTPEEALKALKALKPLGSPLEGGFCDYDEKTETVWVFEMLRYQVGEVLKPKDNQIIGIKKSIEKYKNTPFYCQFIEKYGSSHCLCDTPPLSPLEAPSKPLPSPSRPSSKEKDKDIYSSSSYPHSSDKKKKKQPPPGVVLIPPEIATPGFTEAWAKWHQFRKEIKHKLTPSTEEAQLKKLAELGEEKAIASIEQSIEHGWQGLFEPKEGFQNRNGKQGQSDFGILDRDWTEEEADELLRVTQADRDREDEMDRIREERQKRKEDYLRTHGNLDDFNDD